MFPILFQIYGYEISSYPVVIILGGLFTTMYFVSLCFKTKLMLKFFNDYLFFLVIAVILFSRLGGVLEFLPIYKQDPLNILNIFDGNYNYHSAILGLIISLAGICFFKKEKFWKWLDILSQAFLVFMIFMSLADFLSGENYGTPSTLPWAVSFNIPEVRYTIPVHPIQIYAIISFLIIFLFIKIVKRKKQYHGVIAAYIFLLFFFIESLLSLLKGAPETLIFNISLSLVINAIFASIFLVILVFRKYPNIHFLHQHENL